MQLRFWGKMGTRWITGWLVDRLRGTSAARFRYSSGSGVRRLVVLITDAMPDGFCDGKQNFYGHTDCAMRYANQAGGECVKINAIQVNTVNMLSEVDDIMKYYGEQSCGWYSKVPADGAGIAEAVLKMIYEDRNCGCQ